MIEDLRTRRAVLTAGASLAGLGLVTYTMWSNDDDDVGSDGLTAGTVPAGSDPMLLIRPQRAREQSAPGAVAASVLDSATFEELPGRVSGAFGGERARDEGDELRKLVAVGSRDTPGAAAIAWADWSRDRLVELVASNAESEPSIEAYEGRPVHVAEETAGTSLADGVFALGNEPLVRAVVDVWHGDAAPVENAVLEPFERTDRTAAVRFATTGLAFGGGRPRVAEYAQVVDTSVAATVEDGDATVEITYEVASGDDTERLVTVLERDLGLVEDAEPVEPVLPRGIRGDLSVVSGPAVATVEYHATADSVAEHVDDVLTTLGAVTAGR